MPIQEVRLVGAWLGTTFCQKYIPSTSEVRRAFAGLAITVAVLRILEARLPQS